MRRLVIYFSVLFLYLGCSAQEIKHIVLIGIDGFSSVSLEKAKMPTISQLMNNGTYTLKKRSVLPSSSAPNWASMFMGVPTELHGYTQWGSKEPEIESPVETKNNIPPTIFQIAKKNRPQDKISCVYEWVGMKYLVDTLSLDYHQQAIDYLEHKSLLTDIACKYLQEEKPTLFGVIYASPDDMGHQYGFESDEYYSELELVDLGIKSIIRAVDRAGVLNNTVFIISSDHGGKDKNHGGITLEEMETPFIIAGSGIKSGYKIDEVMMQYDIASIILDLLGIESPSFWRGHSFDCIYGESSGLDSKILNESDRSKLLIKTDYFDINGRRYNVEPQAGIVIRRETMSDGSAKNRKFFKR